MKKPSVTVTKKYLKAISSIKAKYISSERLSKVMGIYPEKINEELSYFEPMLMLESDYNLLALVPALKAYINDEANKKETKKVKEVVTKKKLDKYQSINDFVYQKMSISGFVDKDAYLSDADLRALKRLINEEQAKRKAKK